MRVPALPIRILAVPVGLFLVAGFVPLSLWAAPEQQASIVVGAGQSRLLNRDLELIEDATGALDFEAIKGASGWQSATSLDLGYSTSAFWLRLRLEAVDPGPFVLAMEYPQLDRVDLYYEAPDGVVVHERSGDSVRHSLRELQFRRAAFSIPLDSTARYFYVRVRTGSSVKLQVAVSAPLAFAMRDGNSKLLFGVLFGLLGAMALYNLFIYFSVRDSSYLAYVAFILCVGLAYLTLNGLAFEYLWPESPALDRFSLPASIALANAFSLLFVILFLDTGRYSKIPHAVLSACAIVNFLLVLSAFFLPFRIVIQPVAFMVIVTPIPAVWVSIIAWRKGNKATRFFLLAWVLFFVGSFARAAAAFGLLPTNFLTEHGNEIGSAAEAVLLSFALADRINIMRREREEVRRELLKKDRLAMVGQVSASMVHDIKNPLAIVQGYAEYLQEEDVDAESRLEYAQAIQSEIQRLNEMTQEVLEFSHDRIRIEREQIDSSSFLDGFKRDVERLLNDSAVDFSFQVSDSTLLSVDVGRIRRALFNIVRNAFEVLQGREGRLLVEGLREGSYFVIRVTDNGPGIPEEIRDSLFEPFVTMGKKTGTGLGTAIARKVVEEHGGVIWFQTGLEGTTFYIKLPVQTESSSEADQVAGTSS